MFGILGNNDENYSLQKQINYMLEETDNPAYFVNDNFERQISLTKSLIAFSQQNINAKPEISSQVSTSVADMGSKTSTGPELSRANKESTSVGKNKNLKKNRFSALKSTLSARTVDSKLSESDRLLREQLDKESTYNESIKSQREANVKRIFNKYKKPGNMSLMFCGFLHVFGKLFQYRLKERQRKSDRVGLSGIYLQIIRGLSLGLIAGYMIFLILIYSSGDQLDWAIYVACVTISITVLVCIFSSYAFEIVMLCIPKLFSKQIRWACLLTVFITMSSGPVLNIIRNSNSLRNSMSCIVSQLHTNMDVLEQVLRAPFRLVSEAIDKWTEKVNEIKRRIRNILSKMSFNFLKLKNIFKTQSSWINTFYQSCSDDREMQNQCFALLNDVRYNCEDAGYGYGCQLMKVIAETLCKDLKNNHLTKICHKNQNRANIFISQYEKMANELKISNETNTVMKLIGENDIQMELVRTTEKFEIEGQVNREILDKIKDSSRSAVDMIEFMKQLIKYFSVVLSLLGSFLLVSDSILFHVAWRKFASFQNQYLTEEFLKQEYRSYKAGQLIALPLSRSERWTYSRFSSLSITKFERKRAWNTFGFLLLVLSTVLSVYYLDYSFCYLLNQISSNFNKGFEVMDFTSTLMGENYVLPHGEDSSGQEGWKSFVYDVKAKGRMIAETMNDLTNIFGPFSRLAFDVDVEICAPIVYWADNSQIGRMWYAIVISFLTIPLEVYLMRSRHVFMAIIYPKINARRASWLRATIRNNRGIFSHIIHNWKVKTDHSIFKLQRYTLIGRYLFKNPKNRLLLSKLGIVRQFCSFCGKEGFPKEADFKEDFRQCSECAGFFCNSCQAHLKYTCHSCHAPIIVPANEIDAEKIDYEMDFEVLLKFYLDKSLASKWQMFNTDPPPTEEQEMEMINRRYMMESDAESTENQSGSSEKNIENKRSSAENKSKSTENIFGSSEETSDGSEGKSSTGEKSQSTEQKSEGTDHRSWSITEKSEDNYQKSGSTAE